MSITKYDINKNTKSVYNIPNWFTDLSNSQNSLTSSDQAYRHVPLIFRAVNLIANAVSGVPVRFYSGNGQLERKWPFREEIAGLLWKAVSSQLLVGDAYWERVQNQYGKNITNVKYINPYTITVNFNTKTRLLEYSQTGNASENWVNDPANDKYQIVHFHEFNPLVDYKDGLSATEVAMTNAQLLRYIDRFAAKFFEGGAMPVTFLGMDINTPKEEVSRVEQFVRDRVAGLRNAFNIIGIRAGAITNQSITPPLKDLAMMELHDQARRNIALAFSIPVTMLEDAANYATAVEHRVSFYDETIKPRCIQMQDTINTQLLADVNMRMEFDFDDLEIYQTSELDKQSIEKGRAEIFQVYLNIGLPIKIAAEKAEMEFDEEELAAIEEKMKPKPVPLQLQQTNDDQDQPDPTPTEEDLKKWERKAIKRVKDGKPALCEFESEYIDQDTSALIKSQLAECKTIDEIKNIFDVVYSVEVNELIIALREAVEVMREG